MSKIWTSLKRLIAICVLFVFYEMAWLVSRLRGKFLRKTRPFKNRILLIGTFDNANWFYSHVEPLVRSGEFEVMLVCDEPVANVTGVTFCCPPKWARTVFTRAFAKFIWSIIAMRRFNPDMCMGYHVFPAGVIALVVARLFGCPAAFQVTSGPLELEGGGWHAENRLLIALGGPSRIVERSVLRMLREFDLVVVRGNQAREYIEAAGYTNQLVTITGSVEMPDERASFDERDFDIIFIGRLTEYKRPDRFVDVLTRLSAAGVPFKAVVLGDGPDAPSLKKTAEERGLADRITWNGKTANVSDFLENSRIHVLTSRWEGVSIAMLESMGFGCVPVVADVGDLRDFVVDDVTGFVLHEDDIDGFVGRISQILADADRWERLSVRARREIESRSSKDAVSRAWREALAQLAVNQE